MILTPNEFKALRVIASTNNGHRLRRREWSGLKPSEWKAALAHLIELGLVTKYRELVTREGKQALLEHGEEL